jgi:hypothetical protein
MHSLEEEAEKASARGQDGYGAMCQIPVTAVTRAHKPGCLKQHTLCRGQKSELKMLAGLSPPEGCRGLFISLLFSASKKLPAFLGSFLLLLLLPFSLLRALRLP